MSDFKWTDDAVEELKRLDPLGYSNTQIAGFLTIKFGRIVSRNAVIGKRLRLGLAKPPRLRLAARIRQQPAAPKRRTRSFAIRQPLPAAEEFEPREAPRSKLLPDDIPAAQRKQLFDLRDHDCRWPYGDVGHPDFFFCGAPEANISEDRPYCAFHQRVASAGRGTSGPKIYWRGKRAA